MDCRHVTLGSNPRALLAVNLRNVVVAIVQSGRKVGGSATGFTTPDRSIVYEHNRAASARKEVRGSHAGDSSAYYADIRPEILSQRLELRNFGSSHPDGGRVT
jgi:hypothetical protein